MADKFLVSAGDVIEVQLTSETVVIEGVRGQRSAEPGHITNRMRLFIRETDGKEKKYDFEDTELGVRETQRVVIVRGRVTQAPEPINLLLFNLASDEHDTFEPGLRAFLGHKPFFGPMAKAIVVSLGVALVMGLVARFVYDRGTVTAVFFAIAVAFLLSPILWWVSSTWDSLTEKARYKAARKRFIKDMEGRARAYAPTPAPAPVPAAAPEATPPPEPEAPPAAT